MSVVLRIDGTPPPDLSSLSPAYLTLHIAGGHVLLPFIVATCVISKSTVYHPTIINLFCTWSLYSISSCLLFYAGKSANAASAQLCYVQSALMHGTLPMCATSSLIVVLQIWSLFFQPDVQRNQRSCSTLMLIKLATPYMIFIVFTILTAVFQIRFPEYVHAANGLYCTYYKSPFSRWGTPAFSSIAAGITFGFEIAIGARYFFMSRQISSGFPLVNRSISPIIVTRLVLFNFYALITISAGIAFVSYPKVPVWPFMIQAGVPLAVAVVFGSSKELFLAWSFWKRKRKLDPEAGNGPGVHTAHELVDSADLLVRTTTPSIAVDRRNVQ
ncbi:hypothetical protein D9611_005664 [Ephemerocybe angulata]|uniref:Uncharacterized protein n=1 Tax=Ephemerocybe angulata TaxID=980116 RepID=A0A8H5F4K5_9AGAR|nr:hypothetical protein D9611_005664 [Tulosesus angulatus]